MGHSAAPFPFLSNPFPFLSVHASLFPPLPPSLLSSYFGAPSLPPPPRLPKFARFFGATNLLERAAFRDAPSHSQPRQARVERSPISALPPLHVNRPSLEVQKGGPEEKRGKRLAVAQSSRSRSDGQQPLLGADSSPQRGAGIAQRHRLAELLGAASPAKKPKNSRARRAITAPAPP